MIACSKCRCCEAYVDRSGEKWDWCIWCQDGVPCPGAQRREREAKLPPLRKPLKQVVRLETKANDGLVSFAPAVVPCRRQAKPRPKRAAVRVLAERHEHGTRVRYVCGCRCVECRAANTNYEKDRAAARKAGDWNGLMPATRARNHVKRLSTVGVGYKQVAKVSGVAKTVVAEILSGKKKRIRARTSRRILAVESKSAAPGARVPAKDTWILVSRMTKRGLLKGDIALRLGNARPALQLRKGFVLGRTAEKVAAIYAETVRPRGRAYA